MVTKSTFVSLVLLLTTGWGAFGQEAKQCSGYNAQAAERDIADGKPKLLLQGGIVSVIRAGDAAIEKQFSIAYADFGCVRPAEDRCLRAYSEVVFAYLDKKYGKAWRTQVRKDVLFLTASR
ncbi:FEKKY domain-containing protein [Spirosoma aerophilum]